MTRRRIGSAVSLMRLAFDAASPSSAGVRGTTGSVSRSPSSKVGPGAKAQELLGARDIQRRLGWPLGWLVSHTICPVEVGQASDQLGQVSDGDLLARPRLTGSLEL